jgi:glycosyltransferase involved in cell wall biosynthesis
MLQNGVLGLAVTPGNASALAKGILTLLRQPFLRDAMAQAARQQHEKWFWDQLVHDFIKVYETH